jgi:hypothetical protein
MGGLDFVFGFVMANPFAVAAAVFEARRPWFGCEGLAERFHAKIEDVGQQKSLSSSRGIRAAKHKRRLALPNGKDERLSAIPSSFFCAKKWIPRLGTRRGSRASNTEC